MSDVVILSDTKPGHVNQSLGLAEALQRQCPAIRYHIVPATFQQVGTALLQHQLQACRLIIGAGRRTQWLLCLLGLFSRARTLLLMRPQLPYRCFDLCLVPAHDSPPQRANVIRTQGALNRMQPGQKHPGRAMVLLGGPSKHVHWNNDQIIDQLDQLLTRYPDSNWTLATSRRTPHTLTQQLAERYPEHTQVHWQDTTADWLPRQLSQSEYCWVTQDSVSMLYEALSAGCKTGLLTLDMRANSRLQQGIHTLQEQGLISTLVHPARTVTTGLAEADRCAALILARGWL